MVAGKVFVCLNYCTSMWKMLDVHRRRLQPLCEMTEKSIAHITQIWRNILKLYVEGKMLLLITA